MKRQAGPQREPHPLLVLLLVLCACAGCTSDAGHVPSRPDSTTAHLFTGSRQALRQGKARIALALADSAVRRMPQLADAHFRRGRALSELRRFEEAQEAYQRALALDAGYAAAWFNLGNNASRQQEYRCALRFYREAQAAYPTKAQILLGRTYASLGKADSARQAYRRALAADSTSAAAHAWLSLLLKDQGELEKALRHARLALEQEPENTDYQYILGAQLVHTGQSKEAVELLKAVVEKRPWHYGAHYNLGQALARLGRAGEAEPYLAKADSLRQLQSEIGRLEALTQMEPGELVHWVKLEAKLRQAGRLKEAKRAYRIAQSLRP